LENEKKAGENVTEPFTLDVKQRGKKRVRLEFASDEDRRKWQRAYRKSRYYMFYFMVGVGINFLLYFAGVDLSRNILLGALVGTTLPLSAMFGLTELHLYLLEKKKRG